MKKVLSLLLAFVLMLAASVTTTELFTASAALGASGVTLSVTFEDGTTRDVTVTAHYDLARQVLALVNAERADAGLAPYVWDSSLADEVLLRAVETTVAGDAKNSRHIRPDGTDWDTVLPADRPYGSYAENIAGGMKAASAAVSAWMGSPGHKANILHRSCTSMAVACVEDASGTYYWVQLFGSSTDSGDPDPDVTWTVTFNSNGGSSVSPQTVADGGLVTRPTTPTRSGYTFRGWYRNASLSSLWSFSVDRVSSNITLYAGWRANSSTVIDGGGTPATPGRSSGGSSGSSSSGGGSSSKGSSTPDVFGSGSGSTSSASLHAGGAVSSSELRTQIERAASATTGSTVTVSIKNADSISPAVLQAMRAAAAAVKKEVVLYADTTTADSRSVQGRIYLDDAAAAAIRGTIRPGVYTEASQTAAVKSHFSNYFSNEVAVVHLEQQGSYGARLHIAAKVSLTGLDGSSLRLYSYNRSNNQYTEIQNPSCFVDSSGYLHFYTAQAGEIIIADRPLSAK